MHWKKYIKKGKRLASMALAKIYWKKKKAEKFDKGIEVRWKESYIYEDTKYDVSHIWCLGYRLQTVMGSSIKGRYN